MNYYSLVNSFPNLFAQYNSSQSQTQIINFLQKKRLSDNINLENNPYLNTSMCPKYVQNSQISHELANSNLIGNSNNSFLNLLYPYTNNNFGNIYNDNGVQNYYINFNINNIRNNCNLFNNNNIKQKDIFNNENINTNDNNIAGDIIKNHNNNAPNMSKNDINNNLKSRKRLKKLKAPDESSNYVKVLKNKKIVYINTSLLNSNSNSTSIKKLNRITFVGRNKRSSRYRGVSKNGNLWQVLIMVNKQKFYIGSYPSEEQAARIYDILSLKNRGDKAKTNFAYDFNQIKKITELDIDLKSKDLDSKIQKLISGNFI